MFAKLWLKSWKLSRACRRATNVRAVAWPRLRLEPLETRCLFAAGFNEFALPTAGSGPFGITAGPDGNLWFAEFNSAKIARITPTGTVTEFAVPTASSKPAWLTAGPDGNL